MVNPRHQIPLRRSGPKRIARSGKTCYHMSEVRIMPSIRQSSIISLPSYELTAGGYRAHVCPALGGNCLRLTHLETGAELVRTPECLEDVQINPNVYGTPFLFPPNRITGAAYEFEGRQYSFPANGDRGNHIHGLLSRTAFDVMSLETEEEEARIILQYTATKESPYLSFPHAFRVRIALTLNQEGLSHRIDIFNDSETNMPCGAGFHTTLRAPFLPGAREEDCLFTLGAGREWLLPETVIPDGRTQLTSPLQEALNGEGMVPCTQALSRLFEQTGPAVLRDTASGRAVVYTVDENLRFWMVYNKDGKQRFLCPEPQTWMNDAPNRPFPDEETGFRFIEPGGVMTIRTSLKLV